MTVSNHSRTFEPYHGVVGKVGETIYTMTRVGETTPMWSVDLNKPRFKKHIKQIEFHVMELAK
ncbi:MAG: hypothetical protein JXR12_06495 [Neptunomonas phycophila]|uniref:hypothetical protein n=1 Tax=Neptunomonas phycophila TaxID=1572645 RepID=UPI003B8BD0F9